MRKGAGAVRSIVVLFTSALVIATLAATCAWSYPRFGPDNVHNLVSNGFTGGGTCDACHAADASGIVGDRLLRWGTVAIGDENDGALCTANCHDSTTPELPARIKADVTHARTNPPPVHPHPVTTSDCGSCHNNDFALDTNRHASLGSTGYCECLDCHTTGVSDAWMGVTPAGSDYGTDSEVDKYFSAVGDTSITIADHLSDHSIVYDDALDLCSETNNECLKCHAGLGDFASNSAHPGVQAGDPLLYYPDDIDNAIAGGGVAIAGTGLVKPAAAAPVATWNTYIQASRQNFCLTCHDGVLNSGFAVATDIQIGGGDAPAVPVTVYAPIVGTGAATAMTPPYFTHYEGNGHGIASGIEEAEDPGNYPMDLTCMGGSIPAGATDRLGCHSAHGTTNLSNLEDTNFIDGVDTLAEMGSNVCMSTNCHSDARMMDAATGYPSNLFHSMWAGGDRFLHIDEERDAATIPSTASWDEGARQLSMALAAVSSAKPNLWFFDDEDALLPSPTNRTANLSGTYGTTRNNSSKIGCITCHDPHGTSDNYWNYLDDAYGTQGMLKRYLTTIYYDDDLCGACHVNPNP